MDRNVKTSTGVFTSRYFIFSASNQKHDQSDSGTTYAVSKRQPELPGGLGFLTPPLEKPPQMLLFVKKNSRVHGIKP